MTKNDGGRTFRCNVAVFKDASTVQNVVLPDGHRFIMLMRGQTPKVVGIDDPGVYEIDVLDLGGANYPVALCVVDLAHVPAWARVTVADVSRMIDRVTATIHDREGKDNG